MALSFIEVNPTTGGQSVYSNINLQFVSTEDIFVTIKKADGTVITLTSTQYEVTTSPTLTVTITDSAVSSAIVVNDTIRVFRDTDVSSPARIFSNGSVLKASDLNANHNQILFAQQENDELGIGDALQKDASGAFWDATNLNIRNVLDAVESSDAVTLGQVNAALASAGSVPSVPQAYSTATGTLFNGAISGSDTVFDMTPPPTSEFAQTFIVEIDGVIQRPNDDYTVTTGTTVGTLRILGADVTSQSIVVTNFGLSRQVFDFPTTGQAVTSTTTPLTLQGHPSQTACIFVVEQSDGDDIFCVNNDHVIVNGYGSTTPFTVKQNTDGVTTIARFQNAAGQTVHHFKDPTEATGGGSAFYEITDQNTVNAGNDHMLILRRTAVNDANNSERGSFFICKGNEGAANGGSGRDVFAIKQNGKLLINATDDTIGGNTDATAILQIRSQRSSDVQPYPYIDMRDNNGVQRHAFGISQSVIGGGNDDAPHQTIIGRQDPTGNQPHQLRSGARPQGDGATGTGADAYYWRFFLNGSKAGGNRHTLLTLNAMAENTGTAINIRRVTAAEADSNAIQMTYNGRIFINDACTGRTKDAKDVLRKDEVAKAAGITLCTHNTNNTAVNLVSGTVGIGSSIGFGPGASRTTADTSTYTIASNNSQIAVSQASGVITVGAGTFLATYSVDAEFEGVPDLDFELQLLKDGVIVARSVSKNRSNNSDEVEYMGLNYSELITTTGNTTYQLRGKITVRQNFSATAVPVGLRTRQKSLLIHNLGES